MTTLELVYGEGTPFVGGMASNGGHERSPDTFHLRFDPECEPVPHAIVKAASFVHNVDQSQLAPLADSVDPDALQSLVDGTTARHSVGLEITFHYEDLEVTVSGDGNIWLQWA